MRFISIVLYKNTSDPDKKSKFINHETLNKKTIEQILNEIFSTDAVQNEQEIQNLRKEIDF